MTVFPCRHARPRQRSSGAARRARACTRGARAESDVDSPPAARVGSRQSADVTLPRTELDRIWSPEYLERLARTYWRFLTRVSLGTCCACSTRRTRARWSLLGRPFVLLRFQAPEYEATADCGTVTWPIDSGLLVAPAGRGEGYLRLS